MQTRAINAAAGVLQAAMEQGRQTPTGLAIALDSARLLNSPEHAARVAELEAEREKLVRWHGEDSKTITTLVARVDRHRARLVALQNDALAVRGSLAPADGPRVVPFELGETLTPAVDWLIARVAELEKRLAEYERPADEDPIAYALTEQADDVAPQVAKLRALLAGQATDGTGFFQPGHAYTHRPGPDSPGGDRLRFYCESVTTDRTTGQPVARGWGGRRYGDRWTSVQRARGLEDWQSGQWVDTTDGEREPAAPLTVFRASHDSIVMGLYTTAAEARKHCEAEERRAWAKHHELNFDWIVDEEDGVAEMTAFVGGEECTTGYVVTALEVAAAYDEEADQ